MNYKKGILAVLVLCMILFFTFLFEYRFGWVYSSDRTEVEAGYSKVYVHWLKPMNTVLVSMCDGSSSPRCVRPDDLDVSLRCN